MRRRTPYLALPLLAATLAAGCGGAEDGGSSAKPSSDRSDGGAAVETPKRTGGEVEVKTFIFRPDPIRIEAGSDVTWKNLDGAAHTVTSGRRSKPDGRFDERLSAGGGTVTQRFEEPGTYDYFCSLHSGSGMAGKVIVE